MTDLADDRESASGAEEPIEPRPRPRRRRPEVRIGLPGWTPFAFVGVFALGLVAGVVLTLVLGDGSGGSESASSSTPSNPGTSVSGATSPADTDSADGDDPLAFGTVEITGTPLPRLSDGAGDPAVGMPAPGLAGADYDGSPVSITDDGRAKMVVFLAHWCPYCRQEVPDVRDWVASGDLPDNVDVYSVSTLSDSTRPNYPPATWFAQEAWNVPVIADDGDDSAAGAFGLNAVPFWVLISNDNTIAGRGAGALPVEVLQQVADELAAGPED